MPVSFFFEGGPVSNDKATSQQAPSPAYVTAFLGSVDGLALVKAFTALKDAKLRRRIVELAKEIAANN